MSIVNKCDMCGDIRPHTKDGGPYAFCDMCATRVRKYTDRANTLARKSYDKHVINQVSVFELLEWFYKESPIQFKTSFGQQGFALLEKVVLKLDNSE